MSEDKQYDFYVAGPFFDPEQTASMERLEKIGLSLFGVGEWVGGVVVLVG